MPLPPCMPSTTLSQPTRAAWIEINHQREESIEGQSQPTRAAWIEIMQRRRIWQMFSGRSPLGLRGLKLNNKMAIDLKSRRRSPLGLRGLKYRYAVCRRGFIGVAAHSGCVD